MNDIFIPRPENRQDTSYFWDRNSLYTTQSDSNIPITETKMAASSEAQKDKESGDSTSAPYPEIPHFSFTNLTVLKEKNEKELFRANSSSMLGKKKIKKTK